MQYIEDMAALGWIEIINQHRGFFTSKVTMRWVIKFSHATYRDFEIETTGSWGENLDSVLERHWKKVKNHGH